jgi:hypothetical protein
MAILKNKDLLHMIKALQSFRTHLVVYILVNTVLWFPWLVNNDITMDSYPVYVMLGWGVILVIHCIVAARQFRKERKRS